MIGWLTQRAVRLNAQVCEASATAVSGTVSASRRIPDIEFGKRKVANRDDCHLQNCCRESDLQQSACAGYRANMSTTISVGPAMDAGHIQQAGRKLDL